MQTEFDIQAFPQDERTLSKKTSSQFLVASNWENAVKYLKNDSSDRVHSQHRQTSKSPLSLVWKSPNKTSNHAFDDAYANPNNA